MEDSSNGKVEPTRQVESVDEPKDVAVEDVGDSSKLVQVDSVKVLEINNDENSEHEGKRAISIIEELVESTEKLLDGDDSSSSSSSSSEEEEKEDDDLSEAKVDENEKEEIDGSSQAETEQKTLSSLVENDGVEETKLQASCEKIGSSDEAAVTGVVSKGSERETESTFLDEKIDQASPVLAEEVSKGSDENNSGESSQAVYEAASGNVDHNPEIPENSENPSFVCVTRDSLQPTSWKSCCGLFEVLRRSDLRVQERSELDHED